MCSNDTCALLHKHKHATHNFHISSSNCHCSGTLSRFQTHNLRTSSNIAATAQFSVTTFSFLQQHRLHCKSINSLLDFACFWCCCFCCCCDKFNVTHLDMKKKNLFDLRKKKLVVEKLCDCMNNTRYSFAINREFDRLMILITPIKLYNK